MQHVSVRRPYLLTTALLSVGMIATGLQPAAAASHHTLSKAQIHRIVRMTHYQALRSHHFGRAGAFTVGAAKVDVVTLDGARVAVSMRELRHDVAQAQQLAAGGGSFTTKLKIGRGAKQRITYNVAPSVSQARGSSTRYVIFTRRSQQLNELTAPQHVPSVQALTLIGRHARLAVTLLHNRARGARWGDTGLPSAPLCAMVESLNATTHITVSPATVRRLKRNHVDMSYLTDPNHANPTRRQEFRNLAGRGFEIWSNSMGFAIESARAGTSYHHYVHRVGRMRFGFYPQNEMRYMKVPTALYRSFR